MKASRILGTMFLSLAAANVASADIEDVLDGMEDNTAMWNIRASACTDFTGTYKGNCTVAGKAVPHTVAIKQSGCDVIKFGHKVLLVGGVQSVNASSAKMGASGICKADFNKEGTVLAFVAHGEYRNYAAPEKSMGGHVNGTLKIENNKLVVAAKSTKGEANCTLDKQ